MTTSTVEHVKPTAAEVRRAGLQVDFYLQEIAKLFRPGMQLTLLIRDPNDQGHNAILTDETDPEPICRDIRQLMTAPRGGSAKL